MTGPRIVLGVSGGIAAYKAAEVTRGLVERGARVQVALTRGARKFVSPLTFAVLSGREVRTDVWGSGLTPAVEHVLLADWADLLLIAPATAHTIGKLANGLADDFLSTYFLSHRGPVLLAPAMETRMWEHPAVRRNVRVLREGGAGIVGPGEGFLASGHEGPGRLAEPAEIVEAALRAASGRRDLEGRRLLVTAGPTREALDPVRFLSNRSSGRMGYALAESARDRGGRVTLLAGPTGLTPPAGVRLLRFESADELHALLLAEFPGCEALAMAAAVADFIPQQSRERLHREDGERTVHLEPGPDLLASLKPLARGQRIIAFAAETEELERRGRSKMEAKGADLVVVNDVGRAGIGFDAEENEVIIIRRDGPEVRVSQRSKREVADRIWDAFLALEGSQAETSPAGAPDHGSGGG